MPPEETGIQNFLRVIVRALAPHTVVTAPTNPIGWLHRISSVPHSDEEHMTNGGTCTRTSGTSAVLTTVPNDGTMECTEAVRVNWQVGR